MSENPLDLALAKRFAIRKVGPGGRYYEVAMPREVIEREARRRGLDLEEFIRTHEVECLYDNFEGIIYRFVATSTVEKKASVPES